MVNKKQAERENACVVGEVGREIGKCRDREAKRERQSIDLVHSER